MTASLLLGLAVSKSSAQTSLSLGPSTGSQNTTVEVPLLLNTTRRLGGLQVELNFDQAVAEIGTPTVATTTKRLRVAGSTTAPGKYRLVLFGEEKDLLPSGRLLTIPVTLKQSVPAGGTAISMEEVMLSSEFGLSRSFEMAPYLEVAGPITDGPINPGSAVSLPALADFNTRGITRVQYFSNGELLGTATPSDSFVSWTPSEPGLATIRAIGTTADGKTVNASPITLQVDGTRISTYQTWVDFYFDAAQATDAGISAPTQDPDGDGRDNRREYAEGTNPLTADSPVISPEPFFVRNGSEDYLAVRMRRRVRVPDVAVTAKAGSDLANLGQANATDLEAAGNFEIVTFHTTRSLSTSQRGFLQVVISDPSTQP